MPHQPVESGKGKFHNEDAWRFLTDYNYLRQVSAVDTAIAPIAEYIDMGVMETRYREGKEITMAFNNMLSLAVTLQNGAGEATVDVYAYMDDKVIERMLHANPAATVPTQEERWHLYQRRCIKQSSIISVRDLPPVLSKVAIVTLDTGTATVFYSRSE